ncbi:metalloprotease TIKI1 isoform X4 [Neophocaena asiaeorientalis asiaeorientalis]|uniref:Metalloprotease TIKI n=1 Tax=Neophocaena asiaeorientalis asiaeorientalis TaxID=1706337 RepID=A0A341B975_NEOAA|nr:metalloprotease TIKI1 isoform X4 [Neophocaena asiaeorientalis asiaeorientalis]
MDSFHKPRKKGREKRGCGEARGEWNGRHGGERGEGRVAFEHGIKLSGNKLVTSSSDDNFSEDSADGVPNFINATLPPAERIAAQEIDSYFRWELIYKRNERMGKRVKALLEEFPDKGFFFAFGAGHFMGNNTVLDVLWREGYEVEHAPAGRPINKEKTRNPLSQPAPSAVLAPEAPAPEAQVPEAGSAGPPLLPLHQPLPRSSYLPGEARRKFRKKQRRPQRRQQLRQFSDLWVRLEERSGRRS